MNICSTKSKGVNFKSTPIYNINLKQVTPDGTKLVKAKFSSVSPRDKCDVYTMSKVHDLWSDTLYDYGYTEYIMDDFKKSTDRYERFFIVEIVDKTKELYQRIKSIIEIANPKYPYYDDAEIYFLQSSPKKDCFNTIKGAGEQAVLGAVKIAKKYNKGKVKLISSHDAIPFYKHLGLQSANPDLYMQDDPTNYQLPFELDSQDYKSFIEKVNTRYSQN